MSPDSVTVSRETKAKFDAYEALLRKWQTAVNLVSPDTLPNAMERHILDSAQLTPLIPSAAKTLFDLGSGAGFPGLVLAMTRPDLAVHLVESDSKKCSFLKTVSRETSTPVTVHTARIEGLDYDILPIPDVITARALASLAKLFAYVLPWAERNPELVLVFAKGAQAADEIKEALGAGFTFEVEKQPSQTSPEGAILVISGLQKA